MSVAIDSTHSPFKNIKRLLTRFFAFLGEITYIGIISFKYIFMRNFSVKETIYLMASIGVNSMPIVIVTTAFSGAVLALYIAGLMVKWGGATLVGGTVALSITRELGPALTAVVVAARAGSAIAAEIGTMKVTEQIDALISMGTNPLQYLAVPRLISLIVMMPVLGMLGMFIGCYGGYLVAVINGVTSTNFIESVKTMLTTYDISMGLIKTVVFGIIIALVGCQQGLSTTGGAAGVGRSTMNSVVISIILIYISNFFLADLMFGPKTPGM